MPEENSKMTMGKNAQIGNEEEGFSEWELAIRLVFWHGKLNTTMLRLEEGYAYTRKVISYLL